VTKWFYILEAKDWLTHDEEDMNVPDGTKHCDYSYDCLDHEDLNCAEAKFQILWLYPSDYQRLEDYANNISSVT